MLPHFSTLCALFGKILKKWKFQQKTEKVGKSSKIGQKKIGEDFEKQS